jgi:hypothetical protein
MASFLLLRSREKKIAPNSMAMPLACSPEEEGEPRSTQLTSLTEIVIMSHANWLESHAWAAATVALLGLCGLLFGGCASTAIQAQWADPQFAGRSLRGATVLVVCNASAAAIQHICQDQIAARMLVSAVRPVMASESDFLTAQGEQITDKIFAAARRAGANVIWAATIAPDVTVVSPGPTVGFGIGGFGNSGGWHRWSGVGGGIGVGFPVGAEQVNTAYAADMTLSDVETGRLMWTSKLTTPASRDVTEQVTELVEVGVKSAQQAGFL